MSELKGYRSPKYGHLGVYFLSTGPTGPLPGERVVAVIYSKDGAILRRFEQRAGEVLQEGYVDFFNSPRCRPTVRRLPVVDVAPDGAETVLLEDFRPSMGMETFSRTFGEWALRHGVDEG